MKSPARKQVKKFGKGGLNRYASMMADRLKTPKLSPEEQARIQRAIDQGFTNIVYHSTSTPWDEIDLNYTDVGLHAGTPTQATNRALDNAVSAGLQRNRYGGKYLENTNILPLAYRPGKLLDAPDVGEWKDAYTTLLSLRNAPQLQGQSWMDEMLDAINDEKAAYRSGGEEDWLDSIENLRTLADIRQELLNQGYRQIRYENLVENAQGQGTDLLPEYQARFDELDRMARKLYKKGLSMRPEQMPPEMGATPEAVEAFLQQNPRDPLSYLDPEEAALYNKYRDEMERIQFSPGAYETGDSIIFLDPSDVRSVNAPFAPEAAQETGLWKKEGGLAKFGKGGLGRAATQVIDEAEKVNVSEAGVIKGKADQILSQLPGRNQLNLWIEEGDEAIESGWNSTGDPIVILDRILIDPDLRRQGYGRRVLEQAIRDAAEALPGGELKLLADPIGNDGMDLSDLIEFYESLGFSVDNYQEGMSGVPMSLMLPSSVTPVSKKDGGPVKFGRGGLGRAATDLADKARATDTPEFKNWFGKSKATDAKGNPLVLYHGSPYSDIEEFSDQKTAYGYFFTPDADTADYYTGGRNEGKIYPVYLKTENLLDLDDELEFDRIAREALDYQEVRDEEKVREFAARLYNEGYGKNPEVTKFFDQQEGFPDVGEDYSIEQLLSDNYVNQKEVDDLVARINLDKVTSAYEQSAPVFSPELEEARNAYGSQDFYMNYQDDFMRAAQNLGYDGVVFTDPSPAGESISYVVFDPTQIKSAIGNEGTFDPANPVITKKDGGPVYDPSRIDQMVKDLVEPMYEFEPYDDEAYERQRFAKGGMPVAPRQWLKDVVEEEVRPYITSNPEGHLERMLEMMQRPDYARLPEANRAAYDQRIAEYKARDALNQWLQGTATKYLKRDFATDFDPMRDLSIRHVKSDVWPPREIGPYSEPARAVPQWWKERNQWVEGLDPETPIYMGLRPGTLEEPGLNIRHLRDELMNAITGQGGLPRNLQIRPESLQRMSFPQASELVGKINQWRAEQKAAANAALANNAATKLFKEYPEGYRWVELAPTDDGDLTALEQALKYEGEMMGHCVGGYCPDVSAGRSRIYSLRDPQGQPHVTIEASPDYPIRSMSAEEVWDDMISKRLIEKPSAGMDEFFEDYETNPEAFWAWVEGKYPQRTMSIDQIKGKQNAAPVDKYLPYVQDFVRGGNWSDVQELQNARLRDINRYTPLKDWMQSQGIERPRFLTEDEYQALEADFLLQQLGQKPDGMKEGGIVEDKSVMDELLEAILAGAAGFGTQITPDKYGNIGLVSATLSTPELLRLIPGGEQYIPAASGIASADYDEHLNNMLAQYGLAESPDLDTLDKFALAMGETVGQIPILPARGAMALRRFAPALFKSRTIPGGRMLDAATKPVRAMAEYFSPTSEISPGMLGAATGLGGSMRTYFGNSPIVEESQDADYNDLMQMLRRNAAINLPSTSELAAKLPARPTRERMAYTPPAFPGMAEGGPVELAKGGAPTLLGRQSLQQRARELGLPATGSTERLERLVRAAEADPKTWTQEDFDLIAPHLAIHQDVRPGSAERVESILSEGLRSGMVDPVSNMLSGGYTWARGLRGTDAYLMPYGSLKYQSKDNPRLAPGNMPMLHFRPEPGESMYEAIRRSGRKPVIAKAEGGPVYDPDRIESMVNELMEPQKLAKGGLPTPPKAPGKDAPRAEIPDADYLTPAEREFLNRSVRTGMQVSERVPTSPKFTGDPFDPELTIGVDVIRQSPEQMRKQAETMSQYINYPVTAPTDPESVFGLLGDQAVDNLLFLYDQMPADVRRLSSRWYEGANRIADEAAAKYGIPIEGAAGVYAALSPQMDWFKNVSLGNRVMDIAQNYGDVRFTPEMLRRAEELIAMPGAGFNPETAAIVERIKNSTLSELDTPQKKAIWLRLYDEAHNPRGYSIVDPLGNVIGPSMTGKGEEAKVGWGSLNEIAKALAIFEDPSMENINRRLGEMHKVRSFYNNIVNPYRGGSVTSDTHNVAAALMRPLSGSSPEVMHNLGAASSSNITGARGTYGLYADAVRRAAAERGITDPRAMQSITWEGIRGLYSPEMKRNKSLQERVADAVNQYRLGRVTGGEMREQLLDLGGGIDLPAWYAR